MTIVTLFAIAYGKYQFCFLGKCRKKIQEENFEVIHRRNARVLNYSRTIIGAEQFSQFVLLTLNDEVRATEDEEQKNTLKSLRNFYGNQVSNKLLQLLIQNNTVADCDSNTTKD